MSVNKYVSCSLVFWKVYVVVTFLKLNNNKHFPEVLISQSPNFTINLKYTSHSCSQIFEFCNILIGLLHIICHDFIYADSSFVSYSFTSFHPYLLANQFLHRSAGQFSLYSLPCLYSHVTYFNKVPDLSLNLDYQTYLLYALKTTVQFLLVVLDG